MSRRAYAKLTAQEERRIVALRAEGLTLAAISDRLGCSKAAVCNVLQADKRVSESVDAVVDRAADERSGAQS